MRLLAKTIGREAWSEEMRSVRDESAALVSVLPSAWKEHWAWRDAKTRCLHLCCMMICVSEGITALELLSRRARYLADGEDYRLTLAYASEFVRDLEYHLPDPDWPFPGNPFAA